MRQELKQYLWIRKQIFNLTNENVDIIFNKVHLSTFFSQRENFHTFIDFIIQLSCVRTKLVRTLSKLTGKFYEEKTENPIFSDIKNILTDLFLKPAKKSKELLSWGYVTYIYFCFKDFLLSSDEIVSLLTDFILTNENNMFQVNFYLKWFLPDLKLCSEDVYAKFIEAIKYQIPNRNNNPHQEQIDSKFLLNLFSKTLEEQKDPNFVEEIDIDLNVENFGFTKDDIETAILYDDIELFKNIYNNHDIKINDQFRYKYFLCNTILMHKLTLIQATAFFNSVKIFKFLYFNEANLNLTDNKNFSIMNFAIAGGSFEIIHILEWHHFTVNDSLYFTINYFQNALFDWIFPLVLANINIPQKIYTFLYDTLKNIICAGNLELFNAMIIENKYPLQNIISNPYLLDCEAYENSPFTHSFIFSEISNTASKNDQVFIMMIFDQFASVLRKELFKMKLYWKGSRNPRKITEIIDVFFSNHNISNYNFSNYIKNLLDSTASYSNANKEEEKEGEKLGVEEEQNYVIAYEENDKLNKCSNIYEDEEHFNLESYIASNDDQFQKDKKKAYQKGKKYKGNYYHLLYFCANHLETELNHMNPNLIFVTAIENNSIKCINYLVNNKIIDLNVIYQQFQESQLLTKSLCTAATMGYIKTIAFILNILFQMSNNQSMESEDSNNKNLFDICAKLIYISILHGYSNIIKFILEKTKIDLSQQYSFQDYSFSNGLSYTKNVRYFFMLASIFNKYQIIKLLINSNPQFDIFDHEHWTVLHHFVKNNNPDAIRLLSKFPEVDPNITNNQQETPLFLACSLGYSDCVKSLIESFGSRLNVNCLCNHISPLSAALNTKDITSAEILLKSSNIDLNYKCDNKCSPLHLAVKNRLSKLVIELLSFQKEKNVQYDDIFDNHGMTPLHISVESGFLDITQILMHSEAYRDCVKLQNKLNGMSTLHYAARSFSKDQIQFLLSESAIDLNLVDNEGRTPLMIACENDNYYFVFYFMKVASNKIDINQTDNNNWTALHYAAFHNHEDIVQLLLFYGGKNSLSMKTKDGYSPLHLAVSQKAENSLRALLEENDININEKSNNGKTLLHFVAINGFISGLRMLMNKPSLDKEAKDDLNLTPLDYAKKYHRIGIIRLLQDNV